MSTFMSWLFRRGRTDAGSGDVSRTSRRPVLALSAALRRRVELKIRASTHVRSDNDLKRQVRKKPTQLVEGIHACLCAEILSITHHALLLHTFILSGTSDTLSCSEGTQGQREP